MVLIYTFYLFQVLETIVRLFLPFWTFLPATKEGVTENQRTRTKGAAGLFVEKDGE